MGIFDAIASGISSMIGLGQSQHAENVQQSIAQQNMNMQLDAAQHGIQWKVNDAASVGISPLAAIGAQGVNLSPVSVGSADSSAVTSGIKGMGQGLDDFLAKQSDTAAKTEALKQSLLEAQIAQTAAETTHQQLLNSDAARALSAPGGPPSYVGSSGVPLPSADPRYTEDIKPATQRFRMPDGSVVRAPSQAFTQSSFATDPLGNLRALSIDTSDIPVTRPDVMRAIVNQQLPGPSDYNTP